MTASRDPERLIRAFLDEGPIELPERAYHAVRSTIDQTRQRAVVGPWRDTRMFNRARYALAGLATLAVFVVGVGLFAQRGGLLAPGASPSSTSTPLANPSATPSADAAGPTVRPSTDAAATPPASLTATPAAAAMQPVWRADDDTCTMNDVAVVDDGLVAVGSCRNPEARRYGVAWHSETGFEWRRVFEIYVEVLVAVSGNGDGGGVVLLGEFQLFRGDLSAGFEVEQLPNPHGRGSPIPIDIAHVGQNLFVLGETDVDGVWRPAVWVSSSSEGAWQLINVPDELANIAPDVFLMVADENGFVIAGANPVAPVLWRYDLSSEWGVPDLIPFLRPCTDCSGPGTGEVTALIDSEAAVVDDSLWVKVGDAWHVHTIGEEQHKIDDGNAALRLEDGFIVTGIRGRTYPQDVVATSTDGAEWAVTLLNPDAERRIDPTIRAMVEFDGRVIAVGDGVFIGPARVSDYVP